MADTAVKKYQDYVQQQIDEQAILDKYNAATVAQFNVQREQNRQAENQFYNQMYNTQKTAMDTIRQSNAAAVASGASRGVQAAQELSSLLGLQQESVASATELAQANRQTAQEETAAVLENVLNAYKQAADERAQLRQSAIEAESVEATKEQTAAATLDAQTNRASLITSAAENGSNTYLTSLQMAGIDFSDGQRTVESTQSLNVALNGVTKGNDGSTITYAWEDWDDDRSGAAKSSVITNNLTSIINAYGLDIDKYQTLLDDYTKLAQENDVDWFGANDRADKLFRKYDMIPDGYRIDNRGEYATAMNNFTAYLKNKIYNDYINNLNRKTK